MISRQFALFLAVGGVAALVNIVARIAFDWLMPYEIAIVLAYATGLAVAFLLNRRHVFPNTGDGRGVQLLRFTLVNLVALAQVWAVSLGLLHLVFPRLGFAWHAETVAHVIGVASPVFTSYFGHKHFSFRRVPSAG
ncbi:GtrA family protein [Prosthecomicrobium pneumaticum]|uniref:Putative flippase GtrA n=1 Tax=Prosthecomicrobium pneumaticum TaxID=81895 RepID=A0A7W9FLK9_9HYPH|nr:GtrA family protein [Prosthecomicrobium pneumaticum]MBB5752907.1 putative flippase GtrA [Prosthecomicrobium pneumaticum]